MSTSKTAEEAYSESMTAQTVMATKITAYKKIMILDENGKVDS